MLRLLDEVMDLGERGVALLWVEAEDETAPYAGMRLRDARGGVHQVSAVTSEQGVTTLYLSGGSASYFGRLFRDIRVDGCAFEEVNEPCP